MKMAIVTSHFGSDCLSESITSWMKREVAGVIVMDGSEGILKAYQRAFLDLTLGGILSYLHDDLIIRDEYWYEKVRHEFLDPKVGLVGFGGALEHGDPRIYKKPYDYHQLGRSYFLSNMKDAEAHGERFTGSRDVAVLDGFSLIVRRELLEKAGGWPIGKLDYIAYDYWLCCMAHRLGYKIRLVGVACEHLGGRTYVSKGMGKRPDHWEKFLDAHQYIYNEFKDVLPFSCR